MDARPRSAVDDRAYLDHEHPNALGPDCETATVDRDQSGRSERNGAVDRKKGPRVRVITAGAEATVDVTCEVLFGYNGTLKGAKRVLFIFVEVCDKR